MKKLLLLTFALISISAFAQFAPTRYVPIFNGYKIIRGNDTAYHYFTYAGNHVIRKDSIDIYGQFRALHTSTFTGNSLFSDFARFSDTLGVATATDSIYLYKASKGLSVQKNVSTSIGYANLLLEESTAFGAATLQTKTKSITVNENPSSSAAIQVVGSVLLNDFTTIDDSCKINNALILPTSVIRNTYSDTIFDALTKNSIRIGKKAGRYETASNSFYIHNGTGTITNMTQGRTNSFMRGTMTGTPATSYIVHNANDSTNGSHFISGNTFSGDAYGDSTVVKSSFSVRNGINAYTGFKLSHTPLGKPVFKMINSLGINTFNIDSTGVIARNNIYLDTCSGTGGTANYGVIYKGGVPFIHDFRHLTGGTARPTGQNVFIGNAGNFTMGSTASAVGRASNNVGIGFESLKGLTTGYDNVGLGTSALTANTVGAGNIAFGVSAGKNITGNSDLNIIIGRLGANTIKSTANLTTVNSSIYIGGTTVASANSVTNEIVIGTTAEGNGSNTFTLGNTSLTGLYTSANMFMRDSSMTRVESSSLAAGGTIALTAATTGWGTITVDSAGFVLLIANVHWNNDGTTAVDDIQYSRGGWLTYSSSNTAGNTLSFYQNATVATIKNNRAIRLGYAIDLKRTR